ncbi:hypothetical protein KKF91_13095 [Myxococcota bacterium]|nr:hypothetical protein [Myxococcota bacterium]MBU1431472.1 hypothetical protein [Myxococcota bacterium]MBU1896273.1 hypothetical protein [Myxococcota bacterium]
MTTLRCFIGVQLSAEALNGLRGAQRELYQLARARRTSITNLEKGALSLPLVDLGEVALPALEAVEVTLDRISARHAPFSLVIEGVSAFPDEAQPEIIWAGLLDEAGRLTALQAALTAQLRRYDFPLAAGCYVPHIPLAGAPSGFGALALERRRLGRIRVDHIALFVPSRKRRGARFVPGLQRALTRRPQEITEPSDEALKAELDARLAEFNAQSAQREGPWPQPLRSTSDR